MHKSINIVFTWLILGAGILLLSVRNNCFAQEENETEKGFHSYHELAVSINHTHVFEGRDADGKKKSLTLPSWGIDYTFGFSPRWAVGLHTDLTIEKFKVESTSENGEKEEIERSYPIAPALMCIFKPGKHFSFLLGIGEEFAKEENLTLNRAGIEYDGELPKGWEVFGTLSYDFRWNAYDTWGLGLGIAKKFGKTKGEAE
ncbi:hypothetical protein GS399_19900 [Pedobacter sp. HMF7647]|uniref:Outer membrane beta-barrel protein n=1 Tax=Hufsiella arboris TaxID=2695275 RepID=A0A7K1YF60_9SPHI|nr:hypothetical protein [Hufsiella arboris]MXV53236.1 hypothetical protein [Hufsiella arboris]